MSFFASVLLGQLALVLAAAFAGAAFYVNFVEHPARLTLDDGNLLKQMETQLRCSLPDAGNASCCLGSARFVRSMERRRRALDRGRSAYPCELALYSDRHHADQQQIEGHTGDRRRADITCFTHVVGTPARGPTVLGLAATVAYLWAALH